MWGVRALCAGLGAQAGLRLLSSAAQTPIVDVVICGGGMVGAALAAALSKWRPPLPLPPPWKLLITRMPASTHPLPWPLPNPPGSNALTKSLKVVLLDFQPPVNIPRELPPFADIRVSTLTPASVQLLRSVGAWRSLAPAAAPFCDMQVWDSAGNGYVRYDAASVGADVMGYVVENRLTVAALHQRLRGAGSVQMLMPGSVAAAELPPYSPLAQASAMSAVTCGREGASECALLCCCLLEGPSCGWLCCPAY